MFNSTKFDEKEMSIMNGLIIFVYVFLSVSGIVFFKLGSSALLSFSVSVNDFSLKMSWLAVLGLLFYLLSFFVYMGLIAKNNLSYLIPITTAAVYIATLVSSVLIFKEEVNNVQLFGSVLILFGVLLINLSTK